MAPSVKQFLDFLVFNSMGVKEGERYVRIEQKLDESFLVFGFWWVQEQTRYQTQQVLSD